MIVLNSGDVLALDLTGTATVGVHIPYATSTGITLTPASYTASITADGTLITAAATLLLRNVYLLASADCNVKLLINAVPVISAELKLGEQWALLGNSAASAPPDLSSFLSKNNNLSDLDNVATARASLGLGTAAVLNAPSSGDASSTQLVKGDDTRLGGGGGGGGGLSIADIALTANLTLTLPTTAFNIAYVAPASGGFLITLPTPADSTRYEFVNTTLFNFSVTGSAITEIVGQSTGHNRLLCDFNGTTWSFILV